MGASTKRPPKVIVLTTIQHDEAVVRAIQAGAAGFLTKDTTPDFLLAAIRTVHSGHSVMAPALTNELLRDYTTPGPVNDTVLDDLSGRERDVFLLAAKGLGNADIAGELFLSEATVKSHIGSILGKLKLKNRIQLVAFAYQNHLLR
jgi:DNA-binding NarL/FixJ family response regulator